MTSGDDDLREILIERVRTLPVHLLGHAKVIIESLAAQDPNQIVPATIELAKKEDLATQKKDWPHAPLHRLSEYGTYIVTAGTLQKQRHFKDALRLDLLESSLLTLAKRYGWQLEAWAVFANHYHFVGHAKPGSADLRVLIQHLHANTARELNRLDSMTGRQVWHNYWDTKLTFEKSYQARLSYVHQNAVKHRLVPIASRYRWCSAGWFERTASPAQVKTIYSFKIDKVRVLDDFD